MSWYGFPSSMKSALSLAALACAAACLPFPRVAVAQEPPPIPQSPAAATAPKPPAGAQPIITPPASEPGPDEAVIEANLAQQLLGQPLYLRGGYLNDDLHFDQTGRLLSASPRGSYTLCAIEINKIHLTKRRVELEGLRYGLHFLGALPYEDPTKALDRVRITPKKKVVKISIDREQVVKPKAIKEPREKEGALVWPRKIDPAADSLTYPQQPEVSEGNQSAAPSAAPAPASPATAPASQAAPPAPASPQPVPNSEDSAVLGATTSPAHAAAELKKALDNIFAEGLDDRMKAAMPDFWQRYYQAAAAKTDYRPSDPGVFRQNTVDKKARLISNFEPESNEFAQASGVAGLALYHAVIGPDGKPGEVAVARPIGFGLDENAVDSIRKASFEPALKDGKPVSVLLDLVVQFRIYSKRTAVRSEPSASGPSAGPALPGPYSVPRK